MSDDTDLGTTLAFDIIDMRGTRGFPDDSRGPASIGCQDAGGEPRGRAGLASSLSLRTASKTSAPPAGDGYVGFWTRRKTTTAPLPSGPTNPLRPKGPPGRKVSPKRTEPDGNFFRGFGGRPPI